MKRNIDLDFNLETSEERQEYVTNLLNDLPSGSIKKDDLSLLADYILYGKDKNCGTSIVDRKEVQIDTKYNSYTRKTNRSLEELLDSPIFDENLLKPLTQKTIYKTPKRNFDREKNSSVEPLKPLWKEIDRVAAEIDYFSKKKKIEDFPEDIQTYLSSRKPLTQLKLYKLKHTLIEMRREQFTIQDYFFPTIPNLSYQQIYSGEENSPDIKWQSNNFPIYPLGLLTPHNPNFFLYKEKDSFFSIPIKELFNSVSYPPEQPKGSTQFYLDFTNSNHIYNIIRYYEELEISCYDNPESTIHDILNTLNFYVEVAALPEDHQEILQLKIQKYSNTFIANYINSKYKKHHTPSYISTIFKNQICKDIAAAAQLHYDSYLHRFQKNDFKRCNCCGKLKLKDIRNFARKARSSDGLSTRCKVCDKKDRKEDRKKKKEN